VRHDAFCDALGASDIGELSDIMTHRTLSARSVILWLWKQNRNICPHRDQKEPGSIIYFPLKCEEIAGLLGMTSETVGRNISKLKTDGIIDLLDAKSIELRNVPRLQQIAQSDEDDLAH
jgi:CRP-like cAMP-binding protein